MSQEIVRRKNKIVQAGALRDITDDLRVAAEHSLFIFSKGIMGMNDFQAHLHLPLCNWLQGVPPREKMLLTPRDTFKTSMARCLGMHITIQPASANLYFPGRKGTNLRLLYAAENERKALSRIGWIRRQYESNDLFRALWPDVTWANPDQDSPTWTTSHFSLPRDEDYPEATFESAGVDSGSTGGHYDVIIKDDLIGLRSRKQPQLMVAAIEWWKTSHSLRNNPAVSLDYVFGTRWAAEDLYSYMEENEHTYDYTILSARQQLRLNADGHPYGFGGGNTLLFPERLDSEKLAEMQRKYGELYYLNYENKAVGAGTTAFNMDFCGRFTLDVCGPTATITYDESGPTARILEMIDAGNVVPQLNARIQPFYKLSGEQRTERWNEMIRRWHQDKLTSVEMR